MNQTRSRRLGSFWSATGIETSGIIRLQTTGFLLASQLRRPEPIRAIRRKKVRFLWGDSVFFRQIRTYGITKRLHDALRPLFTELLYFPEAVQNICYFGNRSKQIRRWNVLLVSWLKLILFGKNSDEYSVAFRSLAKEGEHPKRCE